MGDIALVAAKIAPVFTDPGHCEIYQVECGETITAGKILCWDTDGQVILADGDTAALDEPVGVALQGGLAGEVIPMLVRGCVYGFTVAAINTGVILTLSDTDFGIMESAGTGEHCARVWALSGGTTADYVVFFDFDIPAAGLG